MALQIGFSKKFYTLWDVNSSIEYGQASHGEIYSYQVTRYTYLQNLSFDLETAQAKAIEKGCKNLEPNHDLYGRNTSWEDRNSNNYCSFYNSTTPYNPDGGCFTQLDEDGVMKFFKSYHYSDNIHVINRGIQLGVLVRYKDEVMTIEQMENYKAHDELQERYRILAEKGETMEIEIQPTRNLSIGGECGAYLECGLYGVIYFTSYRVMQYNGYEYCLPVDSKGSAKRIKNKTLRVVVEPRLIHNRCELFVQSFQLVK